MVRFLLARLLSLTHTLSLTLTLVAGCLSLTFTTEEGIYYNEYCSQWRLDHGLLVVGYGSLAGNSTEEVQDYWVCKNSYGPGWGSDGYILMARNMDNNCGIASHCTYPIM